LVYLLSFWGFREVKYKRGTTFLNEVMKRSNNLHTFFGIISDEKGEAMIKDLEDFRKMNLKILRKNLKSY